MWVGFLVAAAVFLIVSVIGAIIFGKNNRIKKSGIDSTKIVFVGVVLSAVTLFIPIYITNFQHTDCSLFEVILASIHNMIRLFVVDGEFNFIIENIDGCSTVIYKCYSIFFSFLFVAAPLLTFGFILSFFKNISAYRKYLNRYNSDAYIFSELNEKSIALASSIYEKYGKKCIFVFTDVFESEDEENYELIEKSEALGAICFKKDIVAIDFGVHNKKSHLNFFTIGDDESENLSQSLKIIELFKERAKTNLYVFSTKPEAEILLANAYGEAEKNDDFKIKVRRINEVQSLVSRTLYEDGFDKIFSGAFENENGVKEINAVVVGMGCHGTEMTKALVWYCQMSGYEVRINAFDIDEYAEDRFSSLCPELMDSRFNGDFVTKGEAHYQVKIHSGIDISLKKFDDIIYSLPPTTYVFIALGDDDMNVATAIKLRSLFLRLGYKPQIQAVIYNSDKKEILNNIKNYRKTKYEIDFIGDRKVAYSEKVILDSEVEAEALKRHLKWGDEREFWQYDYNYKSSVASAIHHKAKILCGVPGADKAPADRSEDELWLLRELEHCRWNAYMRSEGYSYSGSGDKATRNDLAKLHHCLVPFDELPLSEQIKDDD